MIKSEFPIGRKITGVRGMTKSEIERNGWDDWHPLRPAPTVLQLDDGSILYTMSDEEGNDAGVLVATRANGDDEYLFVLNARQTRAAADAAKHLP